MFEHLNSLFFIVPLYPLAYRLFVRYYSTIDERGDHDNGNRTTENFPQSATR